MASLFSSSQRRSIRDVEQVNVNERFGWDKGTQRDDWEMVA
jgi:hypothetical protein